jgi:sulfite exporter TauE/SafE
MVLTFLYALSLGFIGSFHCIGMCGPIALTLPVQHLDGVGKQAGILLYNAGRVTAYAGLGVLSGWLGRQFYLGGLQQWLSIILGGGMLLLIIMQYGFPSSRTALNISFYTRPLTRMLGTLLRRRQQHTLYAIGFLNGLLPCGLVWFAITGAIATGSHIQGAFFMAAFGMGTLPAMIALSWCNDLISLRFRNRIRQCIPYAVSIMAILLIMRGLHLNIPYLSPVLPAPNEKVIQHCFKPS